MHTEDQKISRVIQSIILGVVLGIPFAGFLTIFSDFLDVSKLQLFYSSWGFFIIFCSFIGIIISWRIK